ncbi:MAG: Protein with similarity to RtcB [uncultured Sulfurovum sp.]|uniref:3'-phosphate/5'-hydroxy nucleic acid ligase n=1 Tax=uncultured Sulfurovum sp. TaxID=269237 RepID=A0A6S6U5Y0_9BACT|nr:MAG: Protein with similarity to RtcB [uncultured Sulfurovum sp.]
MDKLKIIASSRNWIDSRSVETLENITAFKGVKKVVGLPDLSVGRVPNGMAVLTKNRIYPHLIGGDIGCGMSLFEIKGKSKKIKIEKFEKRLNKLESLDDVRLEEEVNLGYNLGSIGKGNHFIELHLVNEVKDERVFRHSNLDETSLYCLVHSGSRAFGQIVFDTVAGKYDPNEGLDEQSLEAQAYLKKHDKAIDYASQSREIIAKRLLKAIGFGEYCCFVSDTAHNSILKTNDGWLHRKGATPTDKGLVIVAGSRGSLSYLLQPQIKELTALSNYSLAHGAGRKWERSSAEAKLRNRYSKSDLERTAIGSRVLCADKKLLYEEAPQAYKNIDIVIDDLVEAGLAIVVATFRPILTYKE